MASSDYIKLQIMRNREAAERTRQIQLKNQREYEALRDFKSIVARTHATFAASNKAKIKSLESVSKYINYNSFAKKYYRRTMDGITRVGNRITKIGFSFIISMLTKLLNQLAAEISQNKQQIDRYKQKIRQLEREYDREYAKEKKRQEVVNAWEEV